VSGTVSNTTGTADHIDQAIGHYGTGGKLRDTGIILNTKATGKLAFLGKYGWYLQRMKQTKAGIL